MKITDASLRYNISVYVLIFMLMLVGVLSYSALPREAAPEVQIPLFLVSTTYAGVSPADMESLVTQPLEKELSEIDEIKELRSTSAESVSIIEVEFTTETNLDEALTEVREKVDLAKPKLPSEADDPTVTEISTSDFPMMIVNISAPYDLVTLKRVAEKMQDDFETVQGILDVKMAGDIEREIQVQVDLDQLNHYQVSLYDISDAIDGSNINMPGGDVDVGNASFLVRVPSEFESAKEIEDIVVKLRGDYPVYLRDLATVVDTFKERASVSRIDGRPNISLTITKRAGENIIRIADEIKEKIDNARLPTGTEVIILGDESKNIKTMVGELENNMATSLLLVILVIMFAMGFRNSVLVGAAIPLSMLVSFIVISAFGMTLNMVVLFALILALGMLVDNAIVIVENIYRHAQMGKSAFKASAEGTAEVAWPVTTSTITTLAAFFPMVFWPGVMGGFMSYLPKTVIITLSASLFVALVITPVICASFLLVKPDLFEKKEKPETFSDRFMRRYETSLSWAIDNRIKSMFMVGATLIATIAVFGASNLGAELFPETTPRKIFVESDAGDGTRLETSDTIAGSLENIVRDLPNIKHYVADVGVGGGGQGFGGGGGGGSPHKARLSVDFVDSDEQSESVFQTIESLRRGIADIPGARVELVKEQQGPPTGAPVAIELYGEDFDKLGELAAQVRQKIENIDGVVDLKDNYTSGRPEMRIIIDRDKARALNATAGQIASTIRTAINGQKASVLRDGEDEYDITVRLDEKFRNELADIEKLKINVGSRSNPNIRYLIPVAEVAKIESGGGSGSIRHKGRERVVNVDANVDGRLAQDIRNDVIKTLADFELPEGYRLEYAGEDQDSQEAGAFLGRALGIALLLIALTLVTQFNSITLPAVIMLSVMLSLVGVLWGQVLTQMPFGIIMTGVGVISLAGVVVNNGIVLIDYIQQLRREGLPRKAALVKAGAVRLRPVLLTAITTVLGLVPMALKFGIDFKAIFSLDFGNIIQVGGQTADFWQPMAIAVMSGLIFATVLTLVVVPVLYTIFDDLEEKRRSFFGAADTSALETADGLKS